MPKLALTKKRRKPTIAELAEMSLEQARAQAEHGLDAELLRIKASYSIPEVIEMVQQPEKKKTKRSAGRPANPGKFEILDTAAKVKADGGLYSKLAARFQMTPKQLTDLVYHNRSYFERKVREFRTTKNSH